MKSVDCPDNWQQLEFGELVNDIGDGGTPPRNKPEYFNGDINWCTVTDIKRFISDTAERLSASGLRNSSAKLWPENSVILTTGATIGQVGITKIKTATKQGITGIVIKENKADVRYIYYLLGSLTNTLHRYSQGSTFKEIRPTLLSRIPVLVPPLPEQRKIAEILSTVDETIEKTDAIVLETQRLKKGLMQKLFSEGVGHSRFKETKSGQIPEEWQVVRLGELAASERYSIVDGPFGSSVNTNRDYIGSGVPVIRTVNIRPFRFVADDLKFISEELFEDLRRSAVYPGDILLSKVGTIGYACIFPDEFEKAVLSTTGSCKITVNGNKVNNLFLCYQLNHMKPLMDAIASEGVQPFLNMKTIKDFRILLPSKVEQLRIVQILSEVDSRIEKKQAYKSELEQLKMGLMQVLLTGKVRMKV